MKKRLPILLFTIAISIAISISLYALAARAAQGIIYEVGPGKAYPNIGDVPWESLQAGAKVLIYWRSTPYKEKWVICRQGTALAPIIVRGIAGPGGELPVIDGNGATTRSVLNFWNDDRGVIKIGGATVPPNTMPKYITIENLDIRTARTPYKFFAAGGASRKYRDIAASVYVEYGENITLRNCIFRDSGNGVFIGSGPDGVSRDILIEGNDFSENGITNSIHHHNNYTEAVGITFQYNRFRPLRAGCSGNNLKDRSAGTVVRYNWIEGGNYQIDLVNGDGNPVIYTDPRYRETHVYGNIVIEQAAAGNSQMVHYGGDTTDVSTYRKGKLYFYNNTLISTRTDGTTLFALSTNDEHCDARNNIFYVTAAGNLLGLLDAKGVMDLSHNWFKPGWVVSFGTFSGTLNDDLSSVQGSTPGFVDEVAQDYRLLLGSACINAGAALHPLILPANNVIQHYVKHQSSEGRPSDFAFDIGAYEWMGHMPPYLVITTTSLPDGTVGVTYSATLTATGGFTPYLWSIVGSLPAGLSLNAQTGVISGAPTSAGTSNFAVEVTDGQTPAVSASQLFSLTINPAATLDITTTSLPNAKRNKPYSQTLQATGGVKPYSWSLDPGGLPGGLPPGLTLDSTTGVISGRATTVGAWSFTVRAQDSQSPQVSDTQTLSITVTQ